MTYSAPLQQEAGPRAEQQPEHGLRPAVGGALKVPLPMDSEVLLGKEVDGEETQPGSSRSSSELSSVPGSLRSLSECESLSVSPEAEGRSEPKALEEIKVLRWDAELGAWVAHHFPELDGDDGDDLPLEDSPVEEEDITAQTAQLRAAFLGVEVSSQPPVLPAAQATSGRSRLRCDAAAFKPSASTWMAVQEPAAWSPAAYGFNQKAVGSGLAGLRRTPLRLEASAFIPRHSMSPA